MLVLSYIKDWHFQILIIFTHVPDNFHVIKLPVTLVDDEHDTISSLVCMTVDHWAWSLYCNAIISETYLKIDHASQQTWK